VIKKFTLGLSKNNFGHRRARSIFGFREKTAENITLLPQIFNIS